MIDRRFILAGTIAGIAGAYWLGALAVRNLFPTTFSFRPVPSVIGFRQLDAGQVSGNLDPLAGLSAVTAMARENKIRAVRDDVCGALFGSAPASENSVSIASFSDYHCPYCRILTPFLAEWQQENPQANHVEWHEWPTLGEPSMIAARAALAAKRQGAYPALHKRLMRSAFVATEVYLRDVSGQLGIDADKLLSDMEDPAILDDIENTRALASLFGFPGTPSLVVGKTVVIGAISEPDLYALISLERSEGAGGLC